MGRLASAYRRLLLEVWEGTGQGPLSMDQLDELERATAGVRYRNRRIAPTVERG